MDRRVMIGGGVVAAALVLLGIRLASNTGAKSALDDAFTHLPPGFTATHGAVTYSALSGEARVHDLALFRNGAPFFAAGDVAVSGIGAQDETGTPRHIGEIIMHDASGGPYKHIARIDLSGLYPATLRAIFDPAYYPGGKPAWTEKRLVLEHGEVHGIEGAQSGTRGPHGEPVDVIFNVGVLSMDGVRLSQLAAPLDMTAPPAVIAGEIEGRMSQEGGAMKDMTFSVTGQTNAHGSVERASTTKFDAGRMADFTMSGMTVATDKPAGTISMEGASGSGFDFSKMLALLPVVAADPATPHPEILNGMKMQSGELHGLRVDYPTGPLVGIGKMSVRAPANGAPASSGIFTIRRLTITTSGRPISPSSRQALQSFGMEDFTADLDEEGGYDAAAGQVTVKRFDVTLHDLGTLHATMNIAGIPAGGATPAQMQLAAASARLTDASVAWDDGSLTGRLLKMTAARQGVTQDQVRMGLAIPLASLAVLMPDQPDAVAQVNAFLSGQHHLAVTMKPSVPVGLAQWQATPGSQRAALLGARVSGD